MFLFTDCIDSGYQNGSGEYVHQDTDSGKALKNRMKDQQEQYRDEQKKESIFKTGLDYDVTKFFNHLRLIIRI